MNKRLTFCEYLKVLTVYFFFGLHKNNETNENFYQKVAFLMYTETFNRRGSLLKFFVYQAVPLILDKDPFA